MVETTLRNQDRIRRSPMQLNGIIPDDLKETLRNIANAEERTLPNQIIFFLKKAVAEYCKIC